MFDTKSVIVEKVTQEMMNWLDEEKIAYFVQPNLVRQKYVFMPDNARIKAKVMCRTADNNYRKDGEIIMFNDDKDRFNFALVFGEKIKEMKKGL